MCGGRPTPGWQNNVQDNAFNSLGEQEPDGPGTSSHIRWGLDQEYSANSLFFLNDRLRGVYQYIQYMAPRNLLTGLTALTTLS